MGNVLGRFSGIALAAGFYAAVYLLPVSLLQRYFLGHPVAIATTVLFFIALGQLWGRLAAVLAGKRQFAAISDRDLLPESLHTVAGLDDSAPINADLGSHNTPDQTPNALIPHGRIEPLGPDSPALSRIRAWLGHLQAQPGSITSSGIVVRMRELLERQMRRGNTEHLTDDIRDVADRDADKDHDALQFVRIIIWAIPMLGFLGTVIGITQTLGGLDFTDGTAAVDRLKSGLYVAFDTTALGLVLSVVAIFLQFPVERSARTLLDAIDGRAGRLLPQVLAEPSAVDRDDPLRALQQMTVEITKAVQSSVYTQAEIWRQTIDSAHHHWKTSATEASEQMRVVLQESLGDNLATTLKQHTDGLRRVQREGTEQIDNRWQQWQTALSDNARVLLAHQKTLLEQGQLLAESHARAKELERLQSTLDQNLQTLDSTLQSTDRGLQAIQGTGSIADAMMTLAKAVDVLADRIPPRDRLAGSDPTDAFAAGAKPRRKAA